jgi:hypothetical protein
MKTHRVLLLVILVAVVVAAHAVGAVTLSEVGHGVLASDQPISFAVGGLVLIVVVAKLTHLVGFGAFGAGVLRLQELLTKIRRPAGRPVQAKPTVSSAANPGGCPPSREAT